VVEDGFGLFLRLRGGGVEEKKARPGHISEGVLEGSKLFYDDVYIPILSLPCA
jgi:hypothetical protein